MLGSSTTPDRGSARASAGLHVAFRALNIVGIRNVITWLNTQPGESPVNASWPPSQPGAAGTSPMRITRLTGVRHNV